MGFNIKTVYRQIKLGLLRLKSTDLPRTNTKKKKSIEIDKTYKRDVSGHTYEDYEKYKLNNPQAIEWYVYY